MSLSSFLAIIFVLLISFVNGDTECPNVVYPSTGDRRKDKNSLRLVQYNVEWLFVDYYSGVDCPGNGCTWHTTEDAKTHLSYVSNVVIIYNQI